MLHGLRCVKYALTGQFLTFSAVYDYNSYKPIPNWMMFHLKNLTFITSVTHSNSLQWQWY